MAISYHRQQHQRFNTLADHDTHHKSINSLTTSNGINGPEA